MSLDEPLDDDLDLRAAELAFGLLDPPERQQSEARIAAEPAFAAAYGRWQYQAAMLVSGREETPRPSVWVAILARLPANDDAPSRPATLRWWQAGTAAASLAAVLLAVVAIQQRTPVPTPAPIIVQSPARAPLVAVLTGKDQQGVVSISYDPVTGRITAAPNGVDIGQHSAELWVIPADGKPRSLGVIAAGVPGWTRPPAPAAATVAPGVTLAISVEPIGGSPTGLPTGAVILTGKLATT